jgi:hypothetical protein
MPSKTLISIVFGLCFALLITPVVSFSIAIREEDRVFIVDQRGERWEVTQAESLGFKANEFQYGIGRHAFKPLDDSHLGETGPVLAPNHRIIGIADGSQAQAYSISRLSRHEVANTSIGSKPIAVGY